MRRNRHATERQGALPNFFSRICIRLGFGVWHAMYGIMFLSSFHDFDGKLRIWVQFSPANDFFSLHSSTLLCFEILHKIAGLHQSKKQSTNSSSTTTSKTVAIHVLQQKKSAHITQVASEPRGFSHFEAFERQNKRNPTTKWIISARSLEHTHSHTVRQSVYWNDCAWVWSNRKNNRNTQFEICKNWSEVMWKKYTKWNTPFKICARRKKHKQIQRNVIVAQQQLN